MRKKNHTEYRSKREEKKYLVFLFLPIQCRRLTKECRLFKKEKKMRDVTWTKECMPLKSQARSRHSSKSIGD